MIYINDIFKTKIFKTLLLVGLAIVGLLTLILSQEKSATRSGGGHAYFAESGEYCVRKNESDKFSRVKIYETTKAVFFDWKVEAVRIGIAQYRDKNGNLSRKGSVELYFDDITGKQDSGGIVVNAGDRVEMSGRILCVEEIYYEFFIPEHPGMSGGQRSYVILVEE